jgi:hypothetical protein
VKIPAGAKVELTIRNEQAVRPSSRRVAACEGRIPGSAISVYVGRCSAGAEFFDDFHPATRGVVVVGRRRVLATAIIVFREVLEAA